MASCIPYSNGIPLVWNTKKHSAGGTSGNNWEVNDEKLSNASERNSAILALNGTDGKLGPCKLAIYGPIKKMVFTKGGERVSGDCWMRHLI